MTAPTTNDTAAATLTRSEFIALLQTATFQCSEDDGCSGFPAMPSLTNRLVLPGLDVSVTRCFKHLGSAPSEADIEVRDDNPWRVAKCELVVVDDHGVQLSTTHILHLISTETEIMRLDARVPVEVRHVAKETESNEGASMETIIVQRDNDLNIRFVGELIAESASSSNDSSTYYSGSTGRWTELRLYRTRAGKFICASEGCTQWQGEHTRYSAAICETHAEVIAFFGAGWLAKSLYDEAGIKAEIEIE